MSAPDRPLCRHWLIHFEDAEMRPEVFTDEAAARKRYADLLLNWSCHLFCAAEECERLKQPPPIESWKKLVELAYTQGGNGPDLIYAITSHYNAMRAALEKIIRTPVMPFPDRVAHSERAFANAVYGAWARIQGIARQSLQTLDAGTEPGTPEAK